MKRLLAAALSLSTSIPVAVAVPGPLQAATPASVVIQEILDGDELYIERRRARVQERAREPDQLSTGSSRAQLGFDSGAAGRLNRFSRIRLGSTCFLLQGGQILVSGSQNGCVRSARLSVRGTNYIIGLADGGGEAEVIVLEGSLEVRPFLEGKPDDAIPATPLPQGSRARVAADGRVLAVERISAAALAALLAGPLFEGFRQPLPHGERLRRVLRQNVPSRAPLPEANPLSAALLARANGTRASGGLALLTPPAAEVIAADRAYLEGMIPRLLGTGSCGHSSQEFEIRRRATRNGPQVLVSEICGFSFATDPAKVVAETWDQWVRSPAHLGLLRDPSIRSMNCASGSAAGRTLVLCHLWMPGASEVSPP